MRIAVFTICFVLFHCSVVAQSIPADAVPKRSVSVADANDRGTISGRTYTNRGLSFEITFPDTWTIADDDSDDQPKAPNNIGKASRIQMERALQKVQILLTAYRSMPGTADNAVVRISTEDIRLNPAIKDAVDYFDLMRSQYAAMKLPADFRYSETQAEQLGAKQFAFLDTSSNSGKKRMYATVRNGVAIMFTLSYTKDEDLQTLRKVISAGNFNRK
jgi:hypothetical protein